jgi:Nucleotide modification associated domain 2
MKTDSNCSITQNRGCEPTKSQSQKTQQFPTEQPLSDNLDLSREKLLARVSHHTAKAYSYVVRTVAWKDDVFMQKGSAPNFQGGILTLCTCKHQMRAGRDVTTWVGSWLAGFTSRTLLDGKHWLFFLAKIESAIESHAELWELLPPKVRRAKAAHRNFLGDVFEPKIPMPIDEQRYDPNSYLEPKFHAHRQASTDVGWHNDISYHHADRFGNPSLLVADPKLTFLWSKPQIRIENKHPRNYCKHSLSDLLSTLTV